MWFGTHYRTPFGAFQEDLAEALLSSIAHKTMQLQGGGVRRFKETNGLYLFVSLLNSKLGNKIRTL